MNLSAQIKDKAVALWHFQRVRRLVRQQPGVPLQVIVSVAEIPCEDPACSGPATQITVLGLDLVRRIMVIHRPVAEVTEAEIGSALQRL
ncbi:hypothetical protein PANO111632_08790 [Paracoccus nototheniae]|uniref:Uncharacterized protein n=1 Tax=Paracoccus nototheniae TaxID=2489002 RepID=A0ABW4DT73_9RHOB|nr:hypothetical protein [Paracoccus nototheniae]